jgi:hypothetical protein
MGLLVVVLAFLERDQSMHFLERSTENYFMRAATILPAICMLVIGSLFLTVLPASAQAQKQQVQTYQSSIKGTITPAGIANLQNPSPAAQAHTPKRSIKGVRSIPIQGTSTVRGLVNAPAFAHQVGHVLQNFNGVSSLDSEVANFGGEFEPPDQGLCVGNGFVLEPVNSAFTIYRTNGAVVLGPLNVNVLFNEGLTQFTSDPRCYYEKTTHTWIAIILFINSTNTEARTDIAINHSGDPTTPWTVYHLEATDDGTSGTPVHPGCPCLGDQPLLGLDGNNVYISTNEFSILGPAFNGAQIYVLAKSQLFALQPTNFVQFENLTIGGALAASVQPAIAFGHAAAGFFLNSLDPFGTFDNRIGVWALTDGEKVAQGGFPTLSSLLLTSEPYGIPPPAIQQGSQATLDSGDDRMQQVQFIDGSLWGALGTNVTLPNDTTVRAGIAWFKVTAGVESQLISKAKIEKQGYVASVGNYLIYPAIEAGRDNTAVIVFTFSGPANFPSAAYALKLDAASSFRDIRIAAAGTGPYNKGTRWGDYSWATLDPSQNRFWLATEYIPPVSSQTTNGIVNWGTRVFAVDGRS